MTSAPPELPTLLRILRGATLPGPAGGATAGAALGVRVYAAEAPRPSPLQWARSALDARFDGHAWHLDAGAIARTVRGATVVVSRRDRRGWPADWDGLKDLTLVFAARPWLEATAAAPASLVPADETGISDHLVISACGEIAGEWYDGVLARFGSDAGLVALVPEGGGVEWRWPDTRGGADAAVIAATPSFILDDPDGARWRGDLIDRRHRCLLGWFAARLGPAPGGSPPAPAPAWRLSRLAPETALALVLTRQLAGAPSPTVHLPMPPPALPPPWRRLFQNCGCLVTDAQAPDDAVALDGLAALIPSRLASDLRSKLNSRSEVIPASLR